MNNFQSKNQLAFGINKAIFYSITAVFAMQIFGGIIQIPAFYYPKLNHIAIPLGFFVGIVLAIGLLLAMLKTRIKPILNDLKTKISATEFILAVFIWIGFLPLGEYLTSLIPTTGALEVLYRYFVANFELFLNYKIAAFITVCVLAPIFEEILFRGIILKGMLNYNVNPTTAIIVSGFIFGAAHLNPWQFVGAGLLGSIFGFIYYRTKSLILPIILHALNNFLSFTYILKNETTEENIFDVTNLFSIITYTLLAVTLSFILYRITKNK